MDATPSERRVLRDIAKRVRDIAARPEQEAKRRRWREHNALRDTTPLVLCFPEGAWLEAIPPGTLMCRDPILRGWEQRLRMAVYTQEHIADDQVIDPVLNVYWDGGATGWGAALSSPAADHAQRSVYYLSPYSNLSLTSHSKLQAVHYDPPVKRKSDLRRLTPQRIAVNRERSDEWLDMARDLLGDILDVRRRGSFWVTLGGAADTVFMLRGMEQIMMDMIEDPPFVHALVAFVFDSYHACLDQLEREALLSLNNEAEWVGSGGIGYTDQLPGPDFAPGRVRCGDIWGGSTAQHLLGISPKMFETFFAEPIRGVLSRFGLSCFGCCEPVQDWLPLLTRVPNLRRISVSPWADVKRCAEQMRGDYVFSYKPNPTTISTPHVDEQAVRRQLTDSLRIARDHGCVVEVIMKDLHTVQHDPQRLGRWVTLVREAAQQV